MLTEITFGGGLTRFLPVGHRGNLWSREGSPGATLSELLEDIGIGADVPLLIILNGTVVTHENYPTTHLTEGDQLALMPPIQAG